MLAYWDLTWRRSVACSGIRQNENPARVRVKGRGLGNPLIWGGQAGEGSTSANSRAREKFLTKRPAQTARTACALGNAGSHRLVSWNRDRERLTRGRPELDDISAVRLRSVDHNSIHPSASRFTAGASDFPDRSSIRDRSDCGRHPLWRCLGSRIEYRIA